MKEKMIPRCEDPLIWWKTNESTFPLLSKVAKRYLGTVETSSNLQQRVSFPRLEKKSARSVIGLKLKNINMMLFLNTNLKLV